MKKFRVVLRRDAWINYAATVEAATALEASALAEKAWKSGDKTISFEETGMVEFDEVVVDPDDCEEVD